MDTLVNEVRYAVRRLRTNPGFTATVLLTLSLGIGANSAIFSVVNAVLLQPLPYRQPARLVTIFHHYPSLNNLDAPVSAPGFKDYRDNTRLFDGVAVETGWPVNLTGIGEPQRLRGSQVSAQYFSTLGVPAAHGRALLPEEDAVGRNHVVVLSDGLWRRLFAAQPSAVGSTMQLNGEPYRIVGIMPPDFRDVWGQDVELWTPLALAPERYSGGYTNEWLNLVARVKPGITVEQAARDMRGFAEQLKRDRPDQFPPDWTLKVQSMMDVKTGAIRPALLVLLGAVGFVLLIACANVANLLLARAAGRSKEIAIRTALGARSRDLIRQLLTESVLLSLVGGVIGLVLAYGAVRFLVALNPGNLPRVESIAVDGRVALFTLGIALLTGLAFGLAPALQGIAGDLHGVLKTESRGGTTDRSGRLVRRTLVVAEVALALTLLTGAGLLIRSFARLQGVDPGFDPRNVLTFDLSLPASRYPSDTARQAFFDAVLPRIAQVPGVRSVGATSVMPFSGGWSTGSFNVEGYTPPPNGNGPWGDIRVVSPGFLETLRVPLLRGRTFEQRDQGSKLPMVVVDEEFVRRFYKPGVDPIGKRIWFGNSTPNDSTRYITIIGVVGHTKHEGLDADARVQLYFTYWMAGDVNALTVAARTASDPMRTVGAIRAAIRSVDADQPMARIRSLEDMVQSSMGQRRLSMLLLGLFAGLAMLLASVGIYGVMSYSVAQRTRELGVRMALGAARGRVLALVLRQGMVLALLGVAIGLAGAFWLTRLVSSQLYAVRATDPATFVTVALLLIAVAALASFLPALRATRVDPVVALREE
ncbi:MAG TPA: ABC transporter permease [Gemmatimonadaceae bacterium]|nr:ABC transporter permease [Gemmatimonadaceae bacterium]